MKKKTECVLSAKRPVISLRELGYDFAHVISDLVDNSRETGATPADIRVIFEGKDTFASGPFKCNHSGPPYPCKKIYEGKYLLHPALRIN